MERASKVPHSPLSRIRKLGWWNGTGEEKGEAQLAKLQKEIAASCLLATHENEILLSRLDAVVKSMLPFYISRPFKWMLCNFGTLHLGVVLSQRSRILFYSFDSRASRCFCFQSRDFRRRIFSLVFLFPCLLSCLFAMFSFPFCSVSPASGSMERLCFVSWKVRHEKWTRNLFQVSNTCKASAPKQNPFFSGEKSLASAHKK